MNRLKGKVAIVTGAAGGMGEAEAKLFARQGAKVMATDIQGDKLASWVKVAKASGLEIECMPHNVAVKAEWEQVIERTLAVFGHIDILVNNAGIYPNAVGADATTQELWEHVIAVNLTGAFLGTQLCVPHMRSAGGGSIINISSIAGIVGGNGPAYTASKGGLRLLTKDNAVEFAKDNIRVNSIHPGAIVTPMTDFLLASELSKEIIKNICPLGRMGTDMEVAFGALYLASNESSYVTGAELIIDGGLTAR